MAKKLKTKRSRRRQVMQKIADVKLAVSPRVESAVQMKPISPLENRQLLVTELHSGPPIFPAQSSLGKGCKVKMPKGFKDFSPAEKEAARDASKRPWQVEVVFVSEKKAKTRGGIVGPALRLCTSHDDFGPLVPIKTPNDAVELARRYRECVEAGGQKKACALQTAGQGAPLGALTFPGRGRKRRPARGRGRSRAVSPEYFGW